MRNRLHLRPWRRLASVLLAGLLGGCMLFRGDTGGPELTPEQQKKLDEYNAEVTLGRDMAGRLLQFFGTYGDDRLVAYISQVGLYVASQSDFPDRRFMFAILDTEDVNAFACPGGYILVTLGALRQIENEAELAMILGHEIAHVGYRHMFNTLQGLSVAATDDTEEAGPRNAVDAARARPTSDSSQSAELLTRYLSQSSGAAMTLLQAAKAGMGVLLEEGLDEQLEFQADEEGTNYGVRAGYDPEALMHFFNRLEVAKQQKQAKSAVLDKTHPQIKDRKNKLARALRTMDAKRIVGAEGKDRFRDYVRNLPEPNA